MGVRRNVQQGIAAATTEALLLAARATRAVDGLVQRRRREGGKIVGPPLVERSPFIAQVGKTLDAVLALLVAGKFAG